MNDFQGKGIFSNFLQTERLIEIFQTTKVMKSLFFFILLFFTNCCEFTASTGQYIPIK